MKLNEKDVVCITRLLQSAMYAEDEGILCGCQYCLYSNECSQNVKNNGGHMYFRDLFKKLHSMTGIDMSPALYATTEIKFLKGSNEINNQGSIAMKAKVKIKDQLKHAYNKVRCKKNWIRYAFHPFYNISTGSIFEEDGTYQYSTIHVHKGIFRRNKEIARIKYNRKDVELFGKSTKEKNYQRRFLI